MFRDINSLDARSAAFYDVGRDQININIHQSSSHINKLDDSLMNMTSRDVNTGAVRPNVATTNMQMNDSSISKFLCGTFVSTNSSVVRRRA